MRHRSPRTTPAPTPRTPLSAGPRLGARLLKRLGQAGAVAGALVVVGIAVSDKTPAPTAAIIAAESDTRAFLDERAAAHLRRLRASR